jgi:hypothetical protein
MAPDIRWITPLYSFSEGCTHIGTPESARRILKDMADELVGTAGLVAIYVPEGTEDVYESVGQRGRVVGAVRLLKMPSRRKLEDYFYDDWDGSRRWPIGWPCEAVYAPDETLCPTLREHAEHLSWHFGGYVSRFQFGPFPLEPLMRDRLNRDFAQFSRLRAFSRRGSGHRIAKRHP